jgi:hypothetical protein
MFSVRGCRVLCKVLRTLPYKITLGVSCCFVYEGFSIGGNRLEDNKLPFEKIDVLTRMLNGIFASLAARIANVEANLRAVELDYMYGNMTDAAYVEVKKQINQKISSLNDVLLELQKAESSLP